MRDFKSLANIAAFGVGLIVASTLGGGEAEAKSHISVGVGFVFAEPAYVSPYYPPPLTYYYPPAPVVVTPPPVYYAPGYYGYAVRPVYAWPRYRDDDDD